VPGKNQRSVTISKALYEEIQELVERDPKMYSTVSDFVKIAIKEEVRKARVSEPYDRKSNMRRKGGE
jgi:Arc/MetJ-type ribon-helix-helix transcriptional regulator